MKLMKFSYVLLGLACLAGCGGQNSSTAQGLPDATSPSTTDYTSWRFQIHEPFYALCDYFRDSGGYFAEEFSRSSVWNGPFQDLIEIGNEEGFDMYDSEGFKRIVIDALESQCRIEGARP